MVVSLTNLRIHAGRRVAAAEARCARQAERIMSIRAQGQETASAEIELVKFERTLTLIREYERQVGLLADQT